MLAIVRIVRITQGQLDEKGMFSNDSGLLVIPAAELTKRIREQTISLPSTATIAVLVQSRIGSLWYIDSNDRGMAICSDGFQESEENEVGFV